MLADGANIFISLLSAKIVSFISKLQCAAYIIIVEDNKLNGISFSQKSNFAVKLLIGLSEKFFIKIHFSNISCLLSN